MTFYGKQNMTLTKYNFISSLIHQNINLIKKISWYHLIAYSSFIILYYSPKTIFAIYITNHEI